MSDNGWDSLRSQVVLDEVAVTVQREELKTLGKREGKCQLL